ncbi:hypothetical protein [Mesonia aestuariivivens]|uniref:Uncharacterized protein n=1 Tax=Mesonia aestuariivivens TaxID=2796128 RepID=A0ABS6W3B6_9FLAO|nr:hypothetical protein [Mesonia aestuariivivens]MBW2962358.1 hypothetical protein [Mesonia aestuariivivens]
MKNGSKTSGFCESFFVLPFRMGWRNKKGKVSNIFMNAIKTELKSNPWRKIKNSKTYNLDEKAEPKNITFFIQNSKFIIK